MPMIIGKDKSLFSQTLQLVYPRQPFFQFLDRISIIISFVSVLMLPPLSLITAMKPHIADIAGNLGQRRQKIGQLRLVNTTETKIPVPQPIKDLGLQPLRVGELKKHREITHAFPKKFT